MKSSVRRNRRGGAHCSAGRRVVTTHSTHNRASNTAPDAPTAVGSRACPLVISCILTHWQRDVQTQCPLFATTSAAGALDGDHSAAPVCLCYCGQVSGTVVGFAAIYSRKSITQ